MTAQSMTTRIALLALVAAVQIAILGKIVYRPRFAFENRARDRAADHAGRSARPFPRRLRDLGLSAVADRRRVAAVRNVAQGR